jgi:hypothetical protein
MSGVRGESRRLPLWRLHLRGLQVLLRALLQQSDLYPRLQERLPMRRRQAESDLVQGLSAAQVPSSRHVQVGLSLRPPIQLVQDPLSHAEERPPGRSWSPESGGGSRTRGRRWRSAFISTADGWHARGRLCAPFPFHLRLLLVTFLEVTLAP